MTTKEDIAQKAGHTRNQRINTVKMLVTIFFITLGAHFYLTLLLNYTWTTSFMVSASFITGMIGGPVALAWATKIPPEVRLIKIIKPENDPGYCKSMLLEKYSLS